MAGAQVEIVVRAVKVRGHGGDEVALVLPPESLRQLDTGDLGDRVGSFVGSSGPVRSASSAIGCSASQDRCSLSRGRAPLRRRVMGGAEHVRFDHQIVEEKIGD